MNPLAPTDPIDPKLQIADLIAETGVIDLATDKLLVLLRRLWRLLMLLAGRSEVETQRCVIRFTDGKRRTGVIFISRGEPVAVVAVAAADAAEGIDSLLDEVGAKREPAPPAAATPLPPSSQTQRPDVRRDIYGLADDAELERLGLDREDLLHPHLRGFR